MVYKTAQARVPVLLEAAHSSGFGRTSEWYQDANLILAGCPSKLRVNKRSPQATGWRYMEVSCQRFTK